MKKSSSVSTKFISILIIFTFISTGNLYPVGRDRTLFCPCKNALRKPMGDAIKRAAVMIAEYLPGLIETKVHELGYTVPKTSGTGKEQLWAKNRTMTYYERREDGLWYLGPSGGLTRRGFFASAAGAAAALLPLSAAQPQPLLDIVDDLQSLSVEQLITLLKDTTKNESLHMRVVQELGTRNVPEVIEPLIYASRNDTSENVRCGALWALEEHWNNNRDDYKITGIIIIHTWDSHRTLMLTESLRDALLYDSHEIVRRKAALMLGGILLTTGKVGRVYDMQDVDISISALAQALSKDTDMEVRENAVGAFGIIMSRTLLIVSYEKCPSLNAAVSLLINVLLNENESWTVRRNAASALGGQLGGKRAIEPLLQVLLSKDTDPDKPILGLRQAASYALGNVAKLFSETMRNSPNFEKLINILKDTDDSIRSNIARILNIVADSRALSRLLDVVKYDKSDDVRVEAILALGKIGDNTIVPFLIGILENEKETMSCRSAIATALGDIGDNRAVPALIKVVLYNTKDIPLLINAIRALGQIGDKQAMSSLIKQLNHTDWIVREETIWALGQIGDSQALVPLFSYYDNVISKKGPSEDKKMLPPLLSAIAGAGRNSSISKTMVAKRLNLSNIPLDIWNRFGVLVIGDVVFQLLQMYQVLDVLPATHLKKLNLIIAENTLEDGFLVDFQAAGAYFHRNTIVSRKYDFIYVLFHETGHIVHLSPLLSREEKRAFAQLNESSNDDLNNFLKNYISSYAMVNIEEDFAETYTSYTMDTAGEIAKAKLQNSEILKKKIAFIARLFVPENERGVTYIFKYNDDGKITKIKVPLGQDGLPIIPPSLIPLTTALPASSVLRRGL